MITFEQVALRNLIQRKHHSNFGLQFFFIIISNDSKKQTRKFTKSQTPAGKSEKRKSADRRYTRYINDRLYLLIIHRSILTPMNCNHQELRK